MQDETGKRVDLGGGIARVLAPNPSPMTLFGTNSYLIGTDEVAVVDPGPDDPTHLEALLAAIGGRPVSHVIVTHSHVDHSPLAARLAGRVDAPVVAFGDSRAGRSEVMDRLAADGLTGGGEGVDPLFQPDQTIGDGGVLQGAGWRAEAIHTPGHFGNHICLRVGESLLSGDHVMGWASTLVSPPDGDLTDFMASCEKLRGIGVARHLPGHGHPVPDPDQRIDWLIGHRRGREAQILANLECGAATARDLTLAIYTDIPKGMLGMAERNVFAHLIDLVGKNLISADPQPAIDARFSLI